MSARKCLAAVLFAAAACVLWLVSSPALAGQTQSASRPGASGESASLPDPAGPEMSAQAAGGKAASGPGGAGEAPPTQPSPGKKNPGNRARDSQPPNGLALSLPRLEQGADETATAIRVVLGLTLLAVLPSLVVCLTSFMRIIIVLSMLRHAVGMPETPPNTVLVGLALFLTMFTMSPVLQRINAEAFEPFMSGRLGVQPSVQKAAAPLREFMVRQTREQDIGLMVELSRSEPPTGIDDVGNLQLVPAFMLSELRSAFQIGFVVLLPFLLIDLIVSSVLMSLGMMMMPPVTVALPLKVLMFVLVDGWSLLVKALVGSFH